MPTLPPSTSTYEAIGTILHEHGLRKGVLWLKPL